MVLAVGGDQRMLVTVEKWYSAGVAHVLPPLVIDNWARMVSGTVRRTMPNSNASWRSVALNVQSLDCRPARPCSKL